MSVSNIEIGKNLRTIRKERGVSQSQIASLLGVTYQQIQKQELGKNRISAEALSKLQKFYNVPFDIFFHNAEETNSRCKSYPPEVWEMAGMISKIDNTADRLKMKKIINIFLN